MLSTFMCKTSDIDSFSPLFLMFLFFSPFLVFIFEGVLCVLVSISVVVF